MSVRARQSIVSAVCASLLLAALTLVATADDPPVDRPRDIRRVQKEESFPRRTMPRRRQSKHPVAPRGDPDTTAPRIVSLFPVPGTWIVDNVGVKDVKIGFDEPVTVPSGAVTVWTVGGGEVTNFAKSYDALTDTLTLTFRMAIRDDRLTVVVDYTVVDLAGNELDGEILDPGNAALPSGDGRRGGQAVFRFNILQGDANRDGTVDGLDAAIILASLGQALGDPGFDPNADLNGDGVVNALDVGTYTLAEGNALPAVDGVAPSISRITPDPAAALLDDLASVGLSFSEPIDPDRFSERACFLVDGSGDLQVPNTANLAPDGLSASFDFAVALSRCDSYSVNVSNALADASGMLLTPPQPAPEISGFTPPPAPTLDPEHVVMTNVTPVTIAGTAPGGVMVEVSAPEDVFEVAVVDDVFSADVPLAENAVSHVFFTTISVCGGVRSAPIATQITHDGQPPNLFIDFPVSDLSEDSAETTLETTDVAGRVGDVLSGFMGLTVTLVVNGDTANPIEADVDVGIGNNGTFFAPGDCSVPGAGVCLQLGDNLIEATATDEFGNFTTKQITVIQVEIDPNTPQMTVVSGNAQIAQMGTVLPDSIVVLVTHGDGTAFADKVVTFDVTRSNGRLTAEPPLPGEGSMMLQVHTDANGEARAYWRLGSDAGCGNNRVEVASVSIVGTTAFCASATPAPAAQINIGSGNNQRAEGGGPAPEPLRVWVNDACNGIPDIPVTFTVLQGGGKVNGQDFIMVDTSDTGHAEVDFTLGPEPGNNVIEAAFPTNPGAPATFVIFGVARDLLEPTSFSGLVFNNASQPIEGATCSLTIGVGAPLVTTSSANGQFQFDDLSASGPAELFVDGLTATAVNGQPISVGSFPALNYEVVVVPKAENSLSNPVLLPPLDPCNAVVYEGTQDVELTVRMTDPNNPGMCIPAIEGLKMTVKAGSMTRADGTVPSPADPAIIALNQVHSDDIPMPMPDGASPPFAWTLQPAGATFDPLHPVEIVYPNMSGLPPGSVAYFLSFNHDTNRFDIVATGSVTDDGFSIVSDPGAGITKAGWGCNCPPYAATGECEGCPGEPALATPAAAAAGESESCDRPDCDCYFFLDCPECPEGMRRDCYWGPGGLTVEDNCTWVPKPDGTPKYDGVCQCNGTQATQTGIAEEEFDESLIAAVRLWAEAMTAPAEEGGGFIDPDLAEMALLLFDDQDAAQRIGRAVGSLMVLLRGEHFFFHPDHEHLMEEHIVADLSEDPCRVEAGNLAVEALVSELQEPGSGGQFLDAIPSSCPNWQGMFVPFCVKGPGALDCVLEAIQEMAGVIVVPPRNSKKLDLTWTVSVNGQPVQVAPHGTFTVRNISAPDFFGDGGPGTPPDFVSDDFVRVTGISTEFGVTRYAFSEFFQITQGQTSVIQDLTITDTPPPFPESISLSASDSVILVGATTQLATIAQLADGTQQDVTSRSAWTTYRVSNPDIVTVEEVVNEIVRAVAHRARR